MEVPLLQVHLIEWMGYDHFNHSEAKSIVPVLRDIKAPTWCAYDIIPYYIGRFWVRLIPSPAFMEPFGGISGSFGFAISTLARLRLAKERTTASTNFT